MLRKGKAMPNNHIQLLKKGWSIMLHVTCALGKPLWISPKGEYFTEALLPDVQGEK